MASIKVSSRFSLVFSTKKKKEIRWSELSRTEGCSNDSRKREKRSWNDIPHVQRENRTVKAVVARRENRSAEEACGIFTDVPLAC